MIYPCRSGSQSFTPNFLNKMSTIRKQESVGGKQREAEEGQVFLPYESVAVEGECVLLEVCPMRKVKWRHALFLISNILVMFPWLLTYWYPRIRRLFYFQYCSLEESTHLSVLNYDEEVTIVHKEKKVFMTSQMTSRYYTCFTNRYMTYIIDENDTVRVSMYDYRDRVRKIMAGKQPEEGLGYTQAYELEQTYGPGTMLVQRPHCIDLAIKEILRPLYLFLLFSVCYWVFELQYYYFAAALFAVSLVGLFLNLYQVIQLNNKIFGMAYCEVMLNVLREGKIQSLSSLEVVPGDVVFLKQPIKIPFQGVLLEGSVLVNECALTGESVPHAKKADLFENLIKTSTPIDKSAFLYEGTNIIQVISQKSIKRFEWYRQTYGVPVCVIRTNFVTTKGQLIRIILFPKEKENVFEKDSTKYLLFLFLMSIVTFIVMVILIHDYTGAAEMIEKFIDLITITVPPALPVSMTFGVIYAVRRLEDKKIFCIAQNKVVAGGLTGLCCFDKTGTLTEDHMNFDSLLPVHHARFTQPIVNRQDHVRAIEKLQKNKSFRHILGNMACNHSLVQVEETGEIIGNPMEKKTFHFGAYELTQGSKADPDVIYGFESDRGHAGMVYQRFDFEAQRQRMSVVCKDPVSGNCRVFAKGSPESMLTAVIPSSVPKNYQQILKQYASHGFRVLAIASKPIDADYLTKLTRQQAEVELILDGFEIFENRLKPESKGAISQLQHANIGCVMITGDNTLTSSNVSYQCKISDPQKGMIICDFIDGVFVEEKFSFRREAQQEQEQESEQQPHHAIGRDIEIEMVTIDSANLKKPLYDESQLEYHAEWRETRLEDVCDPPLVKEEGLEADFMTELTVKAETTNCQLCVTGRAFNQLFQGPIEDVSDMERAFMNKVTVFARTRPADKARIVTTFQQMGLKVSMCGDGANDCGALKQADIGLSLSQAEASISAPFTAQTGHIESMVELLKQCRAGLATNFSLFNIMATYSLLQYTTTVICKRYLQYPTDAQYLWWDFANFIFIVCIGYTQTADSLTSLKPRGSLFSATNIGQVVVAFLLQLIGQVVVLAAYESQDPDYYSTHGGLDNAILNYDDEGGFPKGKLEGQVLFAFVNNLYIAMMLAFTIATPWRRHFWTNWPLMVGVGVIAFYNQVLILWSEGSWSELEPQYLHSMSARMVVFWSSIGFSLLIYINQKAVLEPLSWWLIRNYPHHKWL